MRVALFQQFFFWFDSSDLSGLRFYIRVPRFLLDSRLIGQMRKRRYKTSEFRNNFEISTQNSEISRIKYRFLVKFRRVSFSLPFLFESAKLDL